MRTSKTSLAKRSMSKPTPVYRLSKKNKGEMVHLALRGFSQQNLVDVKVVAEMLNKLPARHLGGLDSITIFPNSNKKVKAAYRVKKTSSWWEKYVTTNRRIEIYGVSTEDMFYWSMFHELGHFVMDMKLRSSDKKYWVVECHHQRGAVSEYAKRNAQEDFAETYACFLLDPQRLLMSDSKRFSYMKSIVFRATDIDIAPVKKAKPTLDLTV